MFCSGCFGIRWIVGCFNRVWHGGTFGGGDTGLLAPLSDFYLFISFLFPPSCIIYSFYVFCLVYVFPWCGYLPPLILAWRVVQFVPMGVPALAFHSPCVLLIYLWVPFPFFSFFFYLVRLSHSLNLWSLGVECGLLGSCVSCFPLPCLFPACQWG